MKMPNISEEQRKMEEGIKHLSINGRYYGDATLVVEEKKDKPGTKSNKQLLIEFIEQANRPQIKQMMKAMERQKKNQR